LRGSKVEDVVLNISRDDLSPIGQFDVVLFAGVLYHMADPIGTLRQVFSVTKDVAVISTHAVPARLVRGRGIQQDRGRVRPERECSAGGR
jgi:hypothetical protein